MSQEIIEAVHEIEREKGIESGTLVAALEDALLAAYKKTPGAARHAMVELDDNGDFRVFAIELPADVEERLIEEARVRMVVSELRGEKIDIIPWNTDPARFVAKALSPARVREVFVDDETKEATVVVPNDQLALAIGKEGLNARLAARLTGWKIDIVSDTEFAQQEAEAAFGGGGDDVD